MATSNIPPIRLSKLLIVEGRDEENFFTAALGTHLAISDIQVLPVGGKTLLPGSLKALRNDPAFPSVQSLEVIRDADLTPAGSQIGAAASAFASVSSALIAAGVQLPCPVAHGQFAPGPPRVGVFIMPDGSSDGMLETLCVAACTTSPGFQCLNDYFTCLQGHGIVPNNMHKARAHAWLASRPEPDKRLGEAALDGYWPWAAQEFVELWNFLKAM